MGKKREALMVTVLDEEGLITRSDNDLEFIGELLEIFRKTLPGYYQRIEESIESKDGEALRESSHKLKGAIGSMGGTIARETAYELEGMGRNNNFVDAAATLERLKEENNTLIKAVVTLLEKKGAGGRKG